MDKINTLKGKRVLVTGSTGFKGSWLSIWLKRIGAEVHGYALKPEDKKCNFTICGVDKIIDQKYGDVRNKSAVRMLISHIEPEVIFHLAAQPIVLESFEKPRDTFDTNIMGTINVLDAAKELDYLKSVVVVTSDKCYRNSGEMLDENSPLGGDDPYSSSKACQDIISGAYYHSFFKEKGVGLSTARAGNVVGGGDRGKHRLVPDCIRAIEKGTKIVIRNPFYIRPWQYVLEPLYGYLKLAALMCEDHKKYSSAWNFGPQSHMSVSDMAECILESAKAYGTTSSLLNIGDGTHRKEKGVLTIDSSKAKDLLGIKNKLVVSDLARFIVEDYFCAGNFLQQRINRIIQYEGKLLDEV